MFTKCLGQMRSGVPAADEPANSRQQRGPWVILAAASGLLLVVGVGLAVLKLSGDSSADAGDIAATTTSEPAAIAATTTSESGVASTTTSEPEVIATTTTSWSVWEGDQLEEIVDPNDVLVESFGDGWVKGEEWEIRPSPADIFTGCPAFDKLWKLGEWPGAGAVWAGEGSRMSQTVADLGFGAQYYLETARDLPDLCPTIDLPAFSIEVSRPDLSGGVTYQLSAFPIPDPMRQHRLPLFVRTSRAWVVTMQRANVVSVLTIEDYGNLDVSDVESLVSIALAALAEAPSVIPTPTTEAPGVVDQLDEVIDSRDVMVESFGEGWVKQDQWPIEAYTEVSTGCPVFDELLKIDDWGPDVAVWSNGESRLSQKAASFGFEAQVYMLAAQDLPDSCPTIDLPGTELEVNRLDLGFGVEYQLSAYPIPDRATSGRVPEFDTGSQAWVVIMQRSNIISVLTIEVNGNLDAPDVENLASIALATLEGANPLPGGALTRYLGPPPQTPGLVPGTYTLTLGECRNSGMVTVGELTWEVWGLVPPEWRRAGSQQGQVIIVNWAYALFVASDGSEVKITVAGQPDECL